MHSDKIFRINVYPANSKASIMAVQKLLYWYPDTVSPNELFYYITRADIARSMGKRDAHGVAFADFVEFFKSVRIDDSKISSVTLEGEAAAGAFAIPESVIREAAARLPAQGRVRFDILPWEEPRFRPRSRHVLTLEQRRKTKNPDEMER